MYLRYLIPAFLSSEKMKESVENFFDGSQQKGHKSLQILLERGAQVHYDGRCPHCERGGRHRVPWLITGAASGWESPQALPPALLEGRKE
jgi:hypothetical protein